MPADHVIRDPLPWQFGVLPTTTECGRDLVNVQNTITYAEFHEAISEYTDTVRTFRKARMSVPAADRAVGPGPRDAHRLARR